MSQALKKNTAANRNVAETSLNTGGSEKDPLKPEVRVEEVSEIKEADEEDSRNIEPNEFAAGINSD